MTLNMGRNKEWTKFTNTNFERNSKGNFLAIKDFHAAQVMLIHGPQEFFFRTNHENYSLNLPGPERAEFF